MKFVFVSNYLNHHQIPFCRAMYERTGGSFVFLQTEPMEEERVRMGWNSRVEEPYLRLSYEAPQESLKLIREADVVLFGGTDDESYAKERLSTGKPLFRYSERIYKTGQWKAVSPRGLRKKYEDHGKWKKAPVYLLCSGAYVASDFHLIGAYPGKKYCWGYFPETREEDVDKLLQEKGYVTPEGKKVPYLLWSGRMIDWKHPELVVETAQYLRDRGREFYLEMIGGGAMEEQIREMIRTRQLEKYVSLPGFLKPEEVRDRMERADVYLITSDRQEGWGAVANEAMNSGCVVVADHMIGAAPYLIRHGENGMLFRDGDAAMLFTAVDALLEDPKRREALGRKAFETIWKTWNAENAAARLCGLVEELTGIAVDEGEKRDQRMAAERAGKDAKAGPWNLAPCDPAPLLREFGSYGVLTGKRNGS